MLAVGITGNLNIRVLTQLRLELFRVQLLLYNFTGWMSTQSLCMTAMLCVASCSCSTLYKVYIHIYSTSQRGSLVAPFIYSSANCSQQRRTPAFAALLSIEHGSSTRSRAYDNSSRLIHLPDRFSYHTMAPSFACWVADSSHYVRLYGNIIYIYFTL